MAEVLPAPLVKVGILSIGDMGMGIAKLLIAKGFSVSTNGTGRSQDTIDRAEAAQVELLSSDEELVRQCDIIFSVVPPRDAMEVAQRVVTALPAAARTADRPLYFADMNAVAPSTCKAIQTLFDSDTSTALVKLIDGCILGGPPHIKAATADATASSSALAVPEWYRPLMPTSGPDDLETVFPSLAAAMNHRHISSEIGSASGLKMCFGAMSKGYAAISIQAFTAAHKLGVLPDLQWAMRALAPGRVQQTERALTEMAPKAYRWVREMEEISKTFADEAGFEPDLFHGAAGVFRTVAEDTVLGQEKIGQRKRGRTAEDVAAAMAEGLDAKRKKME